jgi:hypothetical protein
MLAPLLRIRRFPLSCASPHREVGLSLGWSIRSGKHAAEISGLAAARDTARTLAGFHLTEELIALVEQYHQAGIVPGQQAGEPAIDMPHFVTSPCRSLQNRRERLEI